MVFTPHKHVGFVCLNRICTNDHSFHQQVGIVFQEVTVLKCARLHLISVTNQILVPRSGGIALGHETPFHPGGKAGPAPTAEIGIFDQVLNFFWSHGSDHSPCSVVATRALVGREVYQPILGFDALSKWFG